MSNDNKSLNSGETLDQESSNSKKNNLPIILGSLLLLFVVGGGIYLSTQRNTVGTNINQSATPAAPTHTTNQQISSGPNGWKVKSSRFCAVKFTAPPNISPYFELINQDSSNPQNRKFWQLREGAQTADGHNIFANNSSLIYIADSEANGYSDIKPNNYTEASGYPETKGYIAGLVGVQCAPKASYSLANIAESYASGLGATAGIKVKSKRTTKFWGKDVVAATFTGGKFKNNEIYFVVTDDKVYKIEKRSDSDKELVRNTTDQIFNTLQFPN